MTAGAVLAVAGATVYYLTAHPMAGVVLMILGVALLILTFSISGALYKVEMINQMKKRDRRRTGNK
jgi:hypothetical protein